MTLRATARVKIELHPERNAQALNVKLKGDLHSTLMADKTVVYRTAAFNISAVRFFESYKKLVR